MCNPWLCCEWYVVHFWLVRQRVFFSVDCDPLKVQRPEQHILEQQTLGWRLQVQQDLSPIKVSEKLLKHFNMWNIFHEYVWDQLVVYQYCVGTSNPSLVSHHFDDTHFFSYTAVGSIMALVSLHKTFGETLGLDRGRVETTTTETWYQWGSWATKNVPKLVVGRFLDVFFWSWDPAYAGMKN